VERLVGVARDENAPADLLAQSEADLLRKLGVLRDGRLTRAGILLVGTEEALRRHVPNFQWTALHILGDTDYSNRADGVATLPAALLALESFLRPYNPIETSERGMYHFEYRLYPERAMREAFLNALCHADYRIPSPILLKLYGDRLTLQNAGGFVGGVRPENILRHRPISRNRLLVDALISLRLVNRANLGVARMYRDMLANAKPPPTFEELGDSVTVTFTRRAMSKPFRAFVADEERNGRDMTVEHLLVLRHVLDHAEIDTPTAADLAQCDERRASDVLSNMTIDRAYLDRNGRGRGTYWTLRPDVRARIAVKAAPPYGQAVDEEAAKAHIVRAAEITASQNPPGITNKEVRQLTRLSRQMTTRLLRELRADGELELVGVGRGARWIAPRSSARN